MDEALKSLCDGVSEGNLKDIARAITLVESDAPRDIERSVDLINDLTSHLGKAVKLGISGAPGVGKSTLIDALGSYLTEQGKRVAVIAVDPSSPISHGSLLGDKTRMPRLSKNPNAFIRPSPSRGALGGLAPKTDGVIKVLDAAGFDVIIVETVGVGQSEIAVSTMVDTFLLLLSPASGDELQGVKKGIVEIAHVIAVTKWDTDLKSRAERTRQEYMRALSGARRKNGKWNVPVLLLSSVTGEGIKALWEKVLEYTALTRK